MDFLTQYFVKPVAGQKQFHSKLVTNSIILQFHNVFLDRDDSQGKSGKKRDWCFDSQQNDQSTVQNHSTSKS